jgi:hypothetical protein
MVRESTVEGLQKRPVKRAFPFSSSSRVRTGRFPVPNEEWSRFRGDACLAGSGRLLLRPIRSKDAMPVLAEDSTNLVAGEPAIE